MIVYVVTRGDYSDYQICGVALSRERAEKLVKLHSRYYDEPQIEEYDTEAEDTDMLDRLIPVYNVEIYPNGANSVWIKHYVDSQKPFNPIFKFSTQIRFGRVMQPLFIANLTAKDAEHAVKIAQDEQAKRLAAAMGL